MYIRSSLFSYKAKFFFQGWSSNGVHTQMYMLEGCSRWDMDRARDAIDTGAMSRTRLYDVRLMCSINNMSKKVLGYELLPEFKPPGKATGKTISDELI